MQLIGAVVPNITRGVPGQAGSYTLRPGQVLQGLGEAYGNVKAQRDLTKTLGGVAQQATSGLQTAPFGGTDPEAYGYGGNKPSLAQQATNLANYTPPTFGQTLAGASPAMRQQMLFPGPAIGRSALGELTGRTGQTPFERVFKEIQSGELGNLAQKREQMRGQVTDSLRKDPFNDDLRGAQLALSPPTELTHLGLKHQEMDQQRAYLTNKEIHGDRALSDLESRVAIGAGLGPQKAKELDFLSAEKKQADEQIKAIDQSTLPALNKETLKSYLRTTMRPMAGLEKHLIEGGEAVQMSNLAASNPLLHTLMTKPAPLRTDQFQQLLTDLKDYPTIQKEVMKTQDTKSKEWDQHQIEWKRLGLLEKNNDLIRQGQLAERYSTEQARWTGQKYNAWKMIEGLPSQPGHQLKKNADGTLETMQQYTDRLKKESPVFRGYQDQIRQADEGSRRAQIEFYKLTNPEHLTHIDSVDVPSQITSYVNDPRIPLEQRDAYLKKIVEKDLPLMRSEYGKGIKGWEEGAVPKITNAVAAGQAALQKEREAATAKKVQEAQAIVPPAVAPDIFQGVPKERQERLRRGIQSTIEAPGRIIQKLTPPAPQIAPLVPF